MTSVTFVYNFINLVVNFEVKQTHNYSKPLLHLLCKGSFDVGLSLLILPNCRIIPKWTPYMGEYRKKYTHNPSWQRHIRNECDPRKRDSHTRLSLLGSKKFWIIPKKIYWSEAKISLFYLTLLICSNQWDQDKVIRKWWIINGWIALLNQIFHIPLSIEN